MQFKKLAVSFQSIFILLCFCLFAVEAEAACQAEACPCGTCSTTTVPSIRCGNGDCQQYAGENHQNCPQDCSGTATCGDGVISSGETCQNCPADVRICGTSCGDRVCSSTLGENCSTCPGDCGTCTSCGDTLCSSGLGETCITCPGDCGTCGTCGNGICNCAPNGTETSANCPQDCGFPTTTISTTTTTTTTVPLCGNGICNCAPNGTETSANCPQDCGFPTTTTTTTTTTTVPLCGNGICNCAPHGTETSANCPQDCGFPTTTTTTTISQCGNGVCNNNETAQSCAADCQCVGGQTLVNGICKCPTGKVLVNGQCSVVPVCKFELHGRSGKDFVHLPVYTSKTPTCLKNLIAEGLTQCRTIWTGGYAKYADNCVASLLLEGRYRAISDGRYRIDAGQDVTLYFDANCNRVDKPAAGSSTCDAGYYQFGASPISLIWDQSFGVENLSENVSLVPFPIDPNQPNKLVEWKASSKAPLLVYDPSGEGKITSGYQLFGNWTFGPKKLASLKDTVDSADGKLWNNGFDALSKLDANSDGEVSGTELEHLSLWFDDNRNAVSEKGEVKRVSSVGVKKLFYRGYANDDAVNAIVLNIGFERERAGKIEQGIMADWFTETVSSELEYAQKALITSAFRKNDQIQSSTIASLNKVSSHSPDVVKDSIKDKSELLSYKKGAALVSGVWEWNSGSNKIPVSGGSFVITDNDDGTISGVTTIELPVESSIGAKSVGLVSSFNGKAKLEVDGSVSLAFELKEKDGTTILQSTAKLNKVGTSMDGASSGKIKSEAANTDISYTWVATKVK